MRVVVQRNRLATIILILLLISAFICIGMVTIIVSIVVFHNMVAFMRITTVDLLVAEHHPHRKH